MPGTPIHVVLETLEQEAIAELQRNEDRLGGGALSVADFMSELRTEAHLIPQLMPAACDLFNAAVSDRPETFYGCVIARAPAPVLRSHLALGLSPYDQATHALFAGCACAPRPCPRARSAPDQAQSKLMRATWGEVARAEDTDGMVPTRSQLHGELLHAATADDTSTSSATSTSPSTTPTLRLDRLGLGLLPRGFRSPVGSRRRADHLALSPACYFGSR
ncbi:hypothetical protein G6O69_36770 [Pseudenhygromyxa sp. WMMC2535]|uniref:hypothetical protein n=1 Tax=Pseudenhygromyxa sp. WMMC2535 TaxID=2712867 RepID=UPI0015554BC8|nr:hypothetical protein [Pseudenhygromyxa sp. WMMC2535]NVB43435.1 hypothetical protein [Pseudenhygromyxa sp. WMMC2535]